MRTALRRLAGKLPRSGTFLRAFLKREWPVFACPIWKDPRQAVADWFLIARTYVRSFFTRDWALEDYPFRVGCVEALNRQPGREPWVGDFWIVHVINWPEMMSFGDSEEEAIACLQTTFEARKSVS